MTTRVERSGDMGQGVKLVMMKDNEGDLHLSIMPLNHLISMNSIEFCNSGTHSRNTLIALKALYKAMEEDERIAQDYNIKEAMEERKKER